MALLFNLLTFAWLPVRRASACPVRRARAKGAMEWISPAQLTSETENGSLVSFAWPRPDFDLAAHEFVIGLLAVACPPRDEKDWLRRFHHPPSQDELAAAFAPYESAFLLDGPGSRFLQDFDALNAEASPVEALFIEAPGANTIKLNKDLLVKRGGEKILSRAAAAMALYTLQQFAPSGGAGHRTSLRGGGPLVTLALPGKAEGAPEPTLWQRIWLNVPRGAPQETSERERIFPWLAPTRTSAKKESVSVVDAHPLQAFFGTPRRIRLVFEKNEAGAPCDLTGFVDDLVVTGFVSEPWGVNYGVWRHPLTPYYKVKADTLPVHAPEGRLGYRQWLGLVYRSGDGSRLPATMMDEARQRLWALADEAPQWAERPLVLAGGFAMDNMKALAFVEAEMPLHLVHDDLANRLSEVASTLVNSARVVDSMLAAAARIALFGEKGKADSDSTTLDVPRERLWEETENEFHRLLLGAIAQLADDEDDERRKQLKESWRETLEKTALSIFDDVAPLDAFGEIDPERIVGARKLLALGLKGYGKYGEAFFKELVLPQPEGARKTRSKSARRKKEEAPA